MSSSTSLTLTERLKKRNPTRLKSLNKIANRQTKGTTTESNKTKPNKKTRKKRKQRNHQDNNNNKVESIIDLTTTTTTPLLQNAVKVPEQIKSSKNLHIAIGLMIIL